MYVCQSLDKLDHIVNSDTKYREIESTLDIRRLFGEAINVVENFNSEQSCALWVELLVASLGVAPNEAAAMHAMFVAENNGPCTINSYSHFFSEHFLDDYKEAQIEDDLILCLPEKALIFSDYNPAVVWECVFHPRSGLVASGHPEDSYLVDPAFTWISMRYHEYRKTALFAMGNGHHPGKVW